MFTVEELPKNKLVLFFNEVVKWKSFSRKRLSLLGIEGLPNCKRKEDKIMEDKNQRCKHCDSKRLKAITGITIGDPLKEEYTTWIMTECEECKFTTTFKTETGKKSAHGVIDERQGSC